VGGKVKQRKKGGSKCSGKTKRGGVKYNRGSVVKTKQEGGRGGEKSLPFGTMDWGG